MADPKNSGRAGSASERQELAEAARQLAEGLGVDQLLAERIERARIDSYLPAIEVDDELGPERYVLLERGHYGQTWISAHASPEAAGEYTVNQEYAEDWSPEVLIDRESGRTRSPSGIAWRMD